MYIYHIYHIYIYHIYIIYIYIYVYIYIFIDIHSNNLCQVASTKSKVPGRIQNRLNTLQTIALYNSLILSQFNYILLSKCFLIKIFE